jgi:hypothetical protein
LGTRPTGNTASSSHLYADADTKSDSYHRTISDACSSACDTYSSASNAYSDAQAESEHHACGYADANEYRHGNHH